MMPPIDIGSKQPTHQLKACFYCECEKPPEGGIAINAKWLCQPCWQKKITGQNLRQNQKGATK
jgi:hypothetical protein